MGLFNLIFRLGTDNRDFNRGMKDVVGRARVASQEMQSNFTTALGGAARGLGTILAGYVTAAQLKNLTDFAGRFRDMSDRTGVAAETLQELDFALKQSGSSVEMVEKAMRKLGEARQAALGDPSGKAASQFGALGISVSELQNLRDSGDLFLRMAQAIEKTNLDANSLPVILDLIGAKNAEVLPAMASGLREAAMEARRLGLIWDEELIVKMDDLGDAIEANLARLKRPMAEFTLFMLRTADYIITMWTAAASAIGGVVNKLVQLDPRIPKSVKRGSQEAADWLDQTFLNQWEGMLDRNDPAVFKRQREARKGPRNFDLDALLAGLKLPVAAKGGGLRTLDRGDSLLSVGNFLGSAPDTAAQQRAQETISLLRQIEAHTRPLQRGALLFD